ncbi:class I SAM-dependent methyltransferase [Pseudomonas massiliensis]|uniref:class I SAM-dependent methyltransferase n=1 Tax=Pseudomonas massiliensis TaxID=522492 RepID=UPI00058F94F5|nr:methyltransferase domain-containing protein [Pseudomonas massiliensis]
MSDSEDYFDELYDGNPDPWAYRRRWYEKRKRDLTLACLPRQRYRRGFEPGCSNGELSAALALRCDRLLCTDLNTQAVELAQRRLAGHQGVEVRQGSLDEQWPTGEFDLIVFSEVGYYLAPAQWQAVARQAGASLSSGGTLLACHWLHPIEGCAMTGREVHRVLADSLELESLVHHIENDFILELWGRQPAGFDLSEVVE